MDMRPCERTYNFQDIEFTPDYINELASSPDLARFLIERKNQGITFTNDELYSLMEAICDNWR